MDPIALEPLGDRAYLAHFADERSAAGWAEAVRDRNGPGVTDVVLAYRSVAVFADPDRVDLAELESRLRTFAIGRAGASGPGPSASGRRLEIPVLYDGEDLEDVAARRGLSPAEVIAWHGGVEYDVFAIGFQPGFPYAGYLPAALSGLPRRDAPRLRVPAGSVAIAGRQTGIYPAESPGGWHLLGRTPLCIVDLDEGYFPIRAGDRIRFRPIPAEEFEARRHDRL
jgi:KipI family sensor histidine kinase inhibitor